jgi:2-haloalkanoic acid dehalogenase type II
MHPTLFTFDIFGTVLDWRTGMRDALAPLNVELTDDGFDRIVDAQGALESGPFRPYAGIVAQSLIEVVGLDPAAAKRVGDDVGKGALYSDARDALARLMRVAPCVAMTNSDRVHRPQVEAQLGFAMTDWFCAEDTGVYKPAHAFWHHVARKRGLRFDKSWWHVSAYADYDLDVVRSLGLTAVFIKRPHHRPGGADYEFRTLLELADYVGHP